VTRSPEAGEARSERRERETWTADERRVFVPGRRMDLGLLGTWQEATRRLKRRRTLRLGEQAPRRPVPSSRAASRPGGTAGRAGGAASSRGAQGPVEGPQRPSGGPRPGQGRLGAAAYEDAERVACRHEALRVGAVCPVGGQGRREA
jgi:hypothetical protein